ncbi:MAG: glycosyltransferase family 4 protein [Armatimonadota bacterium]
MKRVAQALHRYLPVPSHIRYASPSSPAVLQRRLPTAAVHVLYVLFTRRYLQRLAERIPPCDVLHIVDHSESFLLPAVRAHLKVVACHDLIPLAAGDVVYRRPFSRWLGQRLYRLTVRDISCADGVVACSRTTAQDVLRFLPITPERLRVVHDGVDTDFFVPLRKEERHRYRQEMGYGRQEIVLLHVGSNAPYKNIPAVLHTVAYLRHAGHPVRWIKAGQPLSPSLQQMAQELGIVDCLHTEVALDDTRLLRLYQTCDVLLFPSLREGFGLPVLESLACGTPAVIADTPALNEWAGEVCLSAPPNDIQALAEKVLRSAEEGHSPDHRARLREFALQYSWREITRQLVQAYREWGAS